MPTLPTTNTVSMQETVVLYHRGCNDGIASAWAAYATLGEDAIYLPYQYNDPLPEAIFGRHLILVDLSLTPEQIETIYPDQVRSILIIDHHKTALAKLITLESCSSYSEYMEQREASAHTKVRIFGDTQHSGAVLAWAFFNNKLSEAGAQWDQEVPYVLQLIEDYDLWTRQLPETMAVNAWLVNGQLSIERFNSITRPDGKVRMNILETGNALIAYDEKIIRHVMREYVQFLDYEGQQVPLLNAPHHLRNALGDLLAQKYPFVILFTERDGKTIYSLRAKKGYGIDTTLVSSQFGGGGHAESSAFQVKHDAFTNYKHQALLKKPTFIQRLKYAWHILKG